MLEWIFALFSTQGFPARWNCGSGWAEEPGWGWLTIGSDIAIWAAYLSIPVIILYFLQRRRDVPFRSVFLLFGAFILACGATHLIDAIVFWQPVYRLAAVVKFLTAVVSCTTVVTLLRMQSSMLNLRSLSQLEFEVWKRTHDLEEMAERLRSEMQARQTAEASVRSSEERLKMALRAGRMGTWEWDLFNDTMRLDSTEFDILDMPPESTAIPLSKVLKDVHPDDQERFQRSLRAAVEQQTDFDEEFRILRDDGEVQWLAARGKVLFSEQMRPTRIIGVSFDISERKCFEHSLEEARVQAQAANEAKSEFLANMSHEIRTPLTSILGCADLLTPRLQQADHREMAQTIRDQGRLLLGLLNDILDVSKIEAGRLDIHLEPTSIRRIVNDVLSLMKPQADARGLSLTAEYIGRVPEKMSFDPLRVRQILLNLTGNALKFTEHGSVLLRITCDLAFEPVHLQIEVIDTGVGIPSDRLDAIFEAFTQGNPQMSRRVGGTGLGLTICQRLVQLMHGAIHVRSEVNLGSTFLVRLPIGPLASLMWAHEVQTQTEAPSDQMAVPTFLRIPARVLIAEDTPGIRYMLQKMLQDHVELISVVEDGAQALAEAKRALDAGQPYHVILMDMNMPVLNGFDATQQLRESGYRLPIVALTAGATSQDRAQCFQAGCDDYIAKPVEQATLIKIIAQHCPNIVN